MTPKQQAAIRNRAQRCSRDYRCTCCPHTLSVLDALDAAEEALEAAQATKEETEPGWHLQPRCLLPNGCSPCVAIEHLETMRTQHPGSSLVGFEADDGGNLILAFCEAAESAKPGPAEEESDG